MQLTLQQCLDFLDPDESLYGFFERIHHERQPLGVQAVDKHLALRPGVFLEMCGPADSGKTELLIQVGFNVFCEQRYPWLWQKCAPPGLAV